MTCISLWTQLPTRSSGWTSHGWQGRIGRLLRNHFCLADKERQRRNEQREAHAPQMPCKPRRAPKPPPLSSADRGFSSPTFRRHQTGKTEKPASHPACRRDWRSARTRTSDSSGLPPTPPEHETGVQPTRPFGRGSDRGQRGDHQIGRQQPRGDVHRRLLPRTAAISVPKTHEDCIDEQHSALAMQPCALRRVERDIA